jgi:hypothetical protein
MQQQFVLQKCLGKSNGQAARVAGYEGTDEVMRVRGWELAHNPKVQEAILEVAAKFFRDEALASLQTAIALRDDPLGRPEVRLKAAFGLLDRGGFAVIVRQQIDVRHEHSLTMDENVAAVVDVLRARPQEDWDAVINAFIGPNAPDRTKIVARIKRELLPAPRVIDVEPIEPSTVEPATGVEDDDELPGGNSSGGVSILKWNKSEA